VSFLSFPQSFLKIFNELSVFSFLFFLFKERTVDCFVVTHEPAVRSYGGFRKDVRHLQDALHLHATIPLPSGLCWIDSTFMKRLYGLISLIWFNHAHPQKRLKLTKAKAPQYLPESLLNFHSYNPLP